jgi:hypothetical protein
MAANITPNFLLHFPPEVRNLIYGEVFEYNNPMLLLPSTHNPGQVVSSHPIPDIELITLCPQFYREAGSVLYSNNTFLISTLPDACWDAASLGFLTRWLRDIGPTHRDKMRGMQIDLSPLCPPGSRSFRRYVSLEPIMREVWRFQNRIAPGAQGPERADIKFSYVFSGRQLHGGHGHAFPAGLVVPHNHVNLQNLTNIITLLSPDSKPKMCQYLSTPRVLHDIRAWVDGRRVLFLLHTPAHQHISDMGKILFDLNANNQLVQNLANPNILLGIQRTMGASTARENLLSMLLRSPNPKELTYNMNNGTISEELPVIFWINGLFRQESLQKYESIPCIAKLTSQDVKAPTRCFGCWEKWVISSRLFTQQKDTRDNNAPTILTRFELSVDKYLTDVRIPVASVILATLELPEHTEVRVELVCPNILRQTSYKRLCTLQWSLLVFLTDLMVTYPSRKHKPCPEVWMNGRGKVVEAEFENDNGTKLLVQNGKVNWTTDKLDLEKDDCVLYLMEQDGPVTDGADDRADDSSLRGRALKLARFLE